MSKIKIFALGGLNETGKNMYVVNVDENIFILDAGSMYPDDKMLRNNRSFHGFPYPSSPSQRTMPVPVSPKYMGSHLPSVGLTVLLSLTSAVCLHSYLFHPVNSPMLYSLSLYYFIPRCASYFTE